MDNDLYYLGEYLKKNYNMNIKVLYRKKYINNSSSINLNFIYLFLLLFLIPIFLYLYLILNNKYIKFLIIILLIIVIYYIPKYFMRIYLYYKNENIYENSTISHKMVNFQTGDILQEVTNWNYNYYYMLFLLFISNIDFLHNIFVIKFNNKIYGLHYTKHNYEYPENCMNFNNKHIELFNLNDYFNDNSYATKYYRVFSPNIKIDNSKVFDFLKNMDLQKLNFRYFPTINYCKDNNEYNCMSFILKLLNYINFIPKFNFQNFYSVDLEYLPDLSNGKYNESFIINV
jgi:hypothetical protein